MNNPVPYQIKTIKKRSDFLRLSNHGKKFSTSAFLLIAAPHPVLGKEAIHIGYTVTKRLGNAVTRNRIKRRFREAVKIIFPELAYPGYEYVLIARDQSTSIHFQDLTESLRFALSHLHKARQIQLRIKSSPQFIKPHVSKDSSTAVPDTHS